MKRCFKTITSRLHLGLLFALILVIAPLNFSYFLMLPYEKSILPITGMTKPIPTTIVNVLYSILSALVVLILIINSSDRTRKLKKKDYYIVPAVFIALRVIFDFLVVYISPRLSSIVECFIDISMVLFWILFFVFLFMFLKIRIDNKRVFVILSVIALIVLLTVIIIVDSNIAAMNNEASEKYYPFSDEWNAIIMNTGFDSQVFNMIVEGAFLVLICWITAISNHNNISNKERTKKPATRVFCFAICGLFLLMGLTFFKYFVLPYRSVSNTTVDKSDYINHVEKEIEIATKTVTWYRFNEYGDRDAVYCSEVDTVRYSSDVLLKTEGHARPADKRSKAVYEVDGIDVYAILDNSVFAYAKDGKAYYYRAKDLSEAERDDVLISALEKMLLEEPNWEGFEDICRYLQKYDPDEITSVLTRYASGEFYELELECNPNIQPSYVQRIAEKLLCEIK